MCPYFFNELFIVKGRPLLCAQHCQLFKYVLGFILFNPPYET